MWAILLMFMSGDALKMNWEQALEDDRHGKLIGVHVVYRYGHREPRLQEMFRGITNNLTEHVWVNGPGQLTHLGGQQGYTFGQNLRSRYKNLFPDNSQYKVSSLSSYNPAAMMTSAMVLAGLQLPSKDIWHNIHWQPAITYPDEILNKHQDCPRLETLKTNHETKLRSDTYHNAQLYYEVADEIRKKIAGPKGMQKVYTYLEIRKQAGLPIATWAESKFSQIKKVAARVYTYYSNEEYARLEIGRVLDKITQFNTSKTKINLYCTHAEIVGGILAAFNFSLAETDPPNFMAAVVVEIWQLNAELNAQLWYRAGPTNQLVQLFWPKCGVSCPLHQLRKIVDPLIPKDWSNECKLSQEQRTLIFCVYKSDIWYLISLAGSFFATLSYFCQLRSNRKRFLRFKQSKRIIKL